MNYSRGVPDTSRLTAPARRVVIAEVTAAPITSLAHTDAVGVAEAGAVVGFAGVIRDHDHGVAVTGIDYQAHPSAGAVIAEIATSVAAAHAVDALAVTHRVGHLAVGEVALAAAVSAAHRQEAFAAVADLVEQVKARLPVWKRQFLLDGSDEWVGCP